MAKESIHSIDKHCIFRETFNSEADVRRNGVDIYSGSGGTFSFSNGQLKFPGGANDYLILPMSINSLGLKGKDISIRIKIGDAIQSNYTNTVGLLSCYFIGASAGGIDIRIDSSGVYQIVAGSTGSAYSGSLEHSKNDEIVLTVSGTDGFIKFYVNNELDINTSRTIDLYSISNIRIGDIYVGGINYDGSLELLEIYDYALSAEEVSNLYNNSRYKELRGTNEILNVSAQDGSVVNKYTGDVINGSTVPALTLHVVEVAKDGEVNAMGFDGSYSYINCGSYDDLTGDITVAVWVKPYNLGNYENGTILYNGKLQIKYVNNIGIYYVFSNGVNLVFNSNQLGTFNEWVNLVVRRGSDGSTQIFGNGVLFKNGYSGMPEPGTKNITIGNNASGTNAFDGLISDLRIIKGLLTDEEISQLYTSEKHKYGK